MTEVMQKNALPKQPISIDKQIEDIFESMDAATLELTNASSTVALFFHKPYLIKTGVDWDAIDEKQLITVGSKVTAFYNNVKNERMSFATQKAEIKDTIKANLGIRPTAEVYEEVADKVAALNEVFSDWLIEVHNNQRFFLNEISKVINCGLPEGKKLKLGEE